MVLQGILLWVGISVLVTTTASALFRFSPFEEKTKFISNLKVAIAMLLSELVSIPYVLLNGTYGIFGLFGITIYPIEDAILSGILISGGADFVYEIYKTITNFREKIEAQKTIARKVAGSINEEK